MPDILYNILISLIAFPIVLSILVFVHEYGHYIVARACGVKIEAFSIGFGKEVWGRNDRHGTRWKLSALPFGGYVQMFGDASEASTPDDDKLSKMSKQEKAQAFHFKPLWQKSLIVLAGPVFNFIFAYILLYGFIVTYGVTTTPAVAGQVMQGSVAAEVGMMPGDRIVSIDGEEMEEFSDLRRVIALNPGQELQFVIARGDELINKTIIPRKVTVTDYLGNDIEVGQLGVGHSIEIKQVGVFEAFGQAFIETYDVIVNTIKGIEAIIKGIISIEELRGPVGIAEISGQALQKDIEASNEQGFLSVNNLLNIMIFISINLGLVNLLPIPMLDGGHLLFYIYESIFRRPMPEKVQSYAFRMGMVLVLSLMVFATFNDIRRITGLDG